MKLEQQINIACHTEDVMLHTSIAGVLLTVIDHKQLDLIISYTLVIKNLNVYLHDENDKDVVMLYN